VESDDCRLCLAPSPLPTEAIVSRSAFSRCRFYVFLLPAKHTQLISVDYKVMFKRAELAYNLHNVAQCSFVSFVFCLLLMGQGPKIKWNEWMNNTTVSTTSDSDIFLACTHFKMFHPSSVHCPARFINQSRIDTLKSSTKYSYKVHDLNWTNNVSITIRF